MATSDDEDGIADRVEDLIRLRLLLKRLKQQALAKFGRGVVDFDKAPF